MLKEGHNWENDNGSPGIPEIHCTTGVGTQLSCASTASTGLFLSIEEVWLPSSHFATQLCWKSGNLKS